MPFVISISKIGGNVKTTRFTEISVLVEKERLCLRILTRFLKRSQVASNLVVNHPRRKRPLKRLPKYLKVMIGSSLMSTTVLRRKVGMLRQETSQMLLLTINLTEMNLTLGILMICSKSMVLQEKERWISTFSQMSSNAL